MRRRATATIAGSDLRLRWRDRTLVVRGIVAPPDMPAAAVQYWEDVLRKLTQTQGYQQFSSEIELFPKFLTSKEFNQFLDEETESLTKSLARMGELKK